MLNERYVQKMNEKVILSENRICHFMYVLCKLNMEIIMKACK